MTVRNRTAATRPYARPALERAGYAACGAALTWSLVSLLGWWYFSDARERYDKWRVARASR